MNGARGDCLPVTVLLLGCRAVRISDQRTRLDWAACIRELVDFHFAEAQRIVLVIDPMSIHSPTSLDYAFSLAETKGLADKVEIHRTPKHGGWLNMAEIELSVMQRQCVSQRLAARPGMDAAVTVWMTARNPATTRIDWQFTTADARTKLRRLDLAFRVDFGSATNATLDMLVGRDRYRACALPSVAQGTEAPAVGSRPGGYVPGFRYARRNATRSGDR